MLSRDFIWNLIYVGTIIKEYSIKYPYLIIDWNFPDRELNAITIIMGTKDALALEKKYLLYSDIENMDILELKNKLYQMLDVMKLSIM